MFNLQITRAMATASPCPWIKIKAKSLPLPSEAPLHYGFCPLEKLTFKDLAKLTAFPAIFKTKTFFR